MSQLSRVGTKTETAAPLPVSRAAQFMVMGPLISIAFGRWGSYIGVPGTPIFLADVLVFLGAVGLIAGGVTASRGSGAPRLSMQVIAAGAAVCFVVGIAGAQEFGVLTFRDAAPFVYFALIPLFARAASLLGPERITRVLFVAVALHTAWFLPAMLGVLNPIESPIAGVPLFVTRSDFDGLVCGLAIVLAATYKRVGITPRLVIGLGAAAAGLISGSRAGLIAAMVVIVGAILLLRPWRSASKGQIRVALAALVVPGAIGVLAAMGPQAPAWAQGLQKLIPSDSATYATGQNTWDARILAWNKIVDYVGDGPATGNSLSGLGFGSQPVLESGAVVQLSGDSAVRAAHNFFVTWFAFTGVVGVAMVGLIMLVVAVGGLRAQLGGQDATGAIAYCFAMGTALAGLAGVILESPFGYATFALSAGIALRALPDATSHVRGSANTERSRHSPRRDRARV